MSELFEKSIRVLELPRLLEMLEHHAVSAEAKARARLSMLHRRNHPRLLQPTQPEHLIFHLPVSRNNRLLR